MKQEAPMTQFFRKAVDDRRIIISHISLFAAICQCWKNCGCIHPVPVKRRELMRLSKISSFATYHKCIKELHEIGYIRYEPFYRTSGSLIGYSGHVDPSNASY